MIEAMIALATFSFVVIGLATAIVDARQTGESSRFHSEATTLALDKLEHLRTLLPADPQLAAGSHTDSLNPLQPDGTRGGIYTRRWSVTGGLPILGMKTVTMRVTWTDGAGTHTVTLVTYLSLA